MKKFNFENMSDSLDFKDLDIKERVIPFGHEKIKILYIQQLTDRKMLTHDLVKPLILYCSEKQKEKHISAQLTLDSIIYADDCTIESDPDKIQYHILSGMVVVVFSHDKEYLVINLKSVNHRSIHDPNLSYTIRGAKDCFVENLDTNLSLLRYRMKDKALVIKKMEVGVRSNTTVAMFYIEDIANEEIVRNIQKRLESIDIDGICESGELQSFLLNSKFQLFPNMGIIERSDLAFTSLLEGKVVILVDGSELAIYAPKTFTEYFYSSDDRYDGKLFSVFSRLLRYIAFILSFSGTSLFVALMTYHTDVLPAKYVILLISIRSNVPFDPLTGALLIEFFIELLRETLLRVPKQIGPAIGIVGAIVIGQAAISAGIFSPVLLMIAAVELMASFVLPDFTIMNSFRVLKFVLLLATGLLGFFGFTLFFILIMAEIISLDTFGTPLMAPWAPFNKYDFIRSLLTNPTTDPLRPHYTRTKDNTRTSRKNAGGLKSDNSQ